MENEIWNRKLILIATEVQIEGLEHDNKGIAILNNPQVAIWPINKSSDFEKHYKLMGESRLEPGMLLLLSPFDDNTYLELEDSRTILALEKASLTLRLCSLLGAKSVNVKNIKIVDKEKNEELSFEVKYKVIKGNLKKKKTELENIRNQITLNASFSGGAPMIENAEKLLNSNKLNADPFLRNLVNIIKDGEETGNKAKELVQEVSLTHSLQKTFELISSIEFPLGYISCDYNSFAKEKVEIFISLNINF